MRDEGRTASSFIFHLSSLSLRIVLVEPREAGNVGAAARAMKNFGFTDLWIVGGKTERTDDVSSWWAVGALDVVENASRVDTPNPGSSSTTQCRGRSARG